jgi:predicted RNA-binding Zn-ribbon protein involved in translation (DUF1610 family)
MTQPSLKCPQCGRRRVVLGEFAQGVTLGGPVPTRFRAFAARFSSIRNGVLVDAATFACADCGLVWSKVNIDELLAHLQRIGSADVRAWIRDGADTPL